MNFLEEILEVKKEEVKKLHQKYSFSSFSDFEFFESKSLDFQSNLKEDENISIIAEIKKASPSKGIIRDDFDHMQIAEIYFNQNPAAVSILTDEKFFQGSINYLNEIAKKKSAPLLRKDFIIDEYQILEAKSNGADVILLIAEALSKMQINELTHAAYEYGLSVMLELHSESQLEKIDFELNKIIGINNRDLNTFKTDIQTTIALEQKLPEDILVISESGISSKKNIETLKQHRVHGILVGEHLMKQNNIDKAFTELKEWCVR